MLQLVGGDTTSGVLVRYDAYPPDWSPLQLMEPIEVCHPQACDDEHPVQFANSFSNSRGRLGSQSIRSRTELSDFLEYNRLQLRWDELRLSCGGAKI